MVGVDLPYGRTAEGQAEVVVDNEHDLPNGWTAEGRAEVVVDNEHDLTNLMAG